MFFFNLFHCINHIHNNWNSNMENITKDIFAYIHYIRRVVPNIVFIYLGVIITHWIASHLYPQLCCGNTFWGFITSPFMILAPHCEALRWIIQFTGDKIRNAWFWLAGYLVSYIGVKISPLFLNDKYYLNTQYNEDNSEYSPKRKK